jgi:hypothetical protein
MDVLNISRSTYVDAIFNNTNNLWFLLDKQNIKSTFKLKYSVDSETICKFVEYCHNGKKREILINVRDQNKHVIFNEFKILNYEKEKISDSDYYMLFDTEYISKEFINSDDPYYKKIIRKNKISNLFELED